MSLEVVIPPEVLEELDYLQFYLADRFYPLAAIRFVERLVATCQKIGLAPYQGTKNPRTGYRSRGFERVVTIIFDVAEQQVTIVGILYRGRSPEELR